jgi:hypothetical protein
MMIDGLRQCSRKCRELQEGCPHQDCRMWIDYEDEFNCSLISIYENGTLTLRQVGERLGISFARVKQIEQKALLKMRRISEKW